MERSVPNIWRVLLVDDDQEEYVLTREMLRLAKSDRYILDWRSECEGGLEAILTGGYDAVLVDYFLGSSDGVSLIAKAREQNCLVPIILITATNDPEIDRWGMQAGASDFVDRRDLSPALLERTIRYNIRNYRLSIEAQAQIDIERARLATVVQNAPAGIVMTDAQGKFTVVNPEARTLFPTVETTWGGSEPAVGHTLHHTDGSLYKSEDMPIMRALRGETVVNEEMIIRHEDGTEVYVLCNTAPVLQGSSLEGTVTVLRDISEYIQTRRALRESEERDRARASEMEALMNAVPVVVWIARDREGKVIEANQFGYEFLRMTPGTNTSKSADDEATQHFQAFRDGIVIPNDDLPVQRAARGDPVSDYEFDLIFDDGEVRHLLGSATTIYKDGQPNGAVSAFIDITARKQAEQALRKNEERFRMAVSAMKGFVWEHDLARGALFRSEGFQEITGFTVTEIGTSAEDWVARIHPDDRPLEGFSIEEFVQKYSPTYSLEHRFLHKDGHWIWVQEQGRILCDENNHPVRVVGSTIDITTRKEAELALRESEERFHTVLDNTPTVMFTMDKDLRLTWIHNPREDFSGESLLGKSDSDLLDAETAEILMAPKREVLQTGKPVRRELIYQSNGQMIAYHAAFDPVFSPDGAVVGLSAVCMEITDLVRLRQQQIADQARIEIQRRLIDQREQERLQIARDLHDGPLQNFIGVSYSLQGILEETKNQPELATRALQMKQDLIEGINELRSYAVELRPPMLSSFGLEKAINSHLENWRKKHPEINVLFLVDQNGPILPDAPRMALYRIYQELMNNVLKHAQATAVQVRFKKTRRDAELEVQDNGKGFVIPNDWLAMARSKHLGLVGLRERAEAVGGSVTILSAPGKGTTVRVWVPLEEE